MRHHTLRKRIKKAIFKYTEQHACKTVPKQWWQHMLQAAKHTTRLTYALKMAREKGSHLQQLII